MDAVGEEMIGGEARLIKRYANRKLYDTRESRYVTLHQIAEYVRVGEDVQIIDNKTKEDLTNVTLAQIIYEQQRTKEPAAREARSLRGLIREGREKLLTTLLDGPVGKLVARPDEEPKSPSPAEPTGEARVAAEPEAREPRKAVVPSPKEALDELSRFADEHLHALLGGALDTVKQLQSEVHRLQQRIEELEGKLAARRDREKKPGDAE